MKKVVAFVLCAVLLVGCGKGAKTEAKIDEMQAKIDSLTQRVKTMEDDLFAAKKDLVQQQQATQKVNERLQDMENYFNKLQVAQTPR